MLDVRGVFYFVNCQPHKLGLDFGRISFQLSTFNFNLYLGGYSAEVPPLPIPNRVVKLSIADGTALRCGRVGSRHFQKPARKLASLFIVASPRFIRFIALRAFSLLEQSSGLYTAQRYTSNRALAQYTNKKSDPECNEPQKLNKKLLGFYYETFL